VVNEVLGQAAVVEVRELFEHQAGFQLGLGKLLGAVLVSVRRESPASGLVGGLQDPARGFACLHISYHLARSAQVRGISREHAHPLLKTMWGVPAS
jgi:hypothetical protein